MFCMQSYEEFIERQDKRDLVFIDTYRTYIRSALMFILQHPCSEKVTNTEDGVKFVRSEIPFYIELLKENSKYKTTDSWRKLRRSLVVFFKAVGESEIAQTIEKVKNPTPVHQRPSKTGRKKRLTTVTPKIFNKMYENRREAEDSKSCALMTIARLTGARPSEIPDIEMLHFQPKAGYAQVYISGAKKTAKGNEGVWVQRGIDRTLTIKADTNDLIELAVALNVANEMGKKDVKAAQERIRRAGHKIWKSKSKMFCLYSLRYTMGSNLKKACKDHPLKARIIAAVMGHRSTSSQTYYGNIKAGVKTGVPIPSKEDIKKVVDDTKSKTIRRLKQARQKSGKPVPGYLLKKQSIGNTLSLTG